MLSAEENTKRIKTLDNDMNNMIGEVYQSHLRKMLGDMDRCSARCSDNESYTMNENENCRANCTVATQNAQQFVQSEFAQLQNSWQRCIYGCEDKAKSSGATPQSSPDQVFQTCISTCFDTQYNLMKVARSNINKELSSGRYNVKM
ncbi:protein FAM136A-like [Venturia canescens]|uniref:protein FAM136A-like n=1 Tax=Venturia canescens TaxID=32260 RepID=UPI001C9CA43F|nr:protein FAM136A-like [Venturia canescens]